MQVYRDPLLHDPYAHAKSMRCSVVEGSAECTDTYMCMYSADFKNGNLIGRATFLNLDSSLYTTHLVNNC